jgi:hypothetical protein
MATYSGTVDMDVSGLARPAFRGFLNRAAANFAPAGLSVSWDEARGLVWTAFRITIRGSERDMDRNYRGLAQAICDWSP